MKTITICSSIKVLEHLGLCALFPNIEFQPEGPEISMNELKKLQMDHFSAIESSDAIYVINPHGYIGTMVTAEIDYALGIISLDHIQDFIKQ